MGLVLKEVRGGWLLLRGVAQLVECLPSSYIPHNPISQLWCLFPSYKWNMTSKPSVVSACSLPPGGAFVFNIREKENQ